MRALLRPSRRQCHHHQHMLFLFLRRNRRLQTSSVSFDEKTNRTFWEEKNHHRQLYAQLPERIKRAVLAQIPRDLLASSKTNKKTVVAVALSGGVDSFVSAGLLKNALQAAAVGEKGENIKLKAILMKNWDELEETNSECLFLSLIHI